MNIDTCNWHEKDKFLFSSMGNLEEGCGDF